MEVILIKLIPITLKQANEFVLSHHRHHSKVQGCKFCVGVVDERNKIRGVAIVGRPVSRYIDSGVIPKFAGCVNGVQWFKDRGQWQDGSFEPSAGQIIFFDWDNKGSSGPQDGQSDHVGIVEKCENGIVYTIEGNSGDSCRQNQYPVGHYEILGYECPGVLKNIGSYGHPFHSCLILHVNAASYVCYAGNPHQK